MDHGWATTRGNLEDPEIFKEYTDVHTRVAEFFERFFSA